MLYTGRDPTYIYIYIYREREEFINIIDFVLSPWGQETGPGEHIENAGVYNVQNTMVVVRGNGCRGKKMKNYGAGEEKKKKNQQE